MDFGHKINLTMADGWMGHRPISHFSLISISSEPDKKSRLIHTGWEDVADLLTALWGIRFFHFASFLLFFVHIIFTFEGGWCVFRARARVGCLSSVSRRLMVIDMRNCFGFSFLRLQVCRCELFALWNAACSRRWIKMKGNVLVVLILACDI